jgi:hypothetical protein
VQSEIHGSSQCDGILPLPENENNEGYYFFIEGGFYFDHGCNISEKIVNDTKESLKSIVQKIRDETNPNTATSIDTSKASKRKSPYESATLAAALLEKLAKNTDASNHSPPKDIKVYSRPSRKGTKQLRSFTFPTFISQTLELSPYHGTLCPSEELIFPNVPSSNNLTLDQLDLKVGVGYLFSHCGGCEHLIVVTDIREYHDALDGDDVSLYPCTLSTIYGRKRKCQACESYGAAYVVFNDRLTETNPCFLCK